MKITYEESHAEMIGRCNECTTDDPLGPVHSIWVNMRIGGFEFRLCAKHFAEFKQQMVAVFEMAVTP